MADASEIQSNIAGLSEVVSNLESNIAQVLGNITNQLRANMEKVSSLNMLLEEALKKSISLLVNAKVKRESDTQPVLKIQFGVDYSSKGSINDAKLLLSVTGNEGRCSLTALSENHSECDNVVFMVNEPANVATIELLYNLSWKRSFELKLPPLIEVRMVELRLEFPHPAAEGTLAVTKEYEIGLLKQMVFEKVSHSPNETTAMVNQGAISVSGASLREILGLTPFESLEVPSSWISQTQNSKILCNSKIFEGIHDLMLTINRQNDADTVDVSIICSSPDISSTIASELSEFQ